MRRCEQHLCVEVLRGCREDGCWVQMKLGQHLQQLCSGFLKQKCESAGVPHISLTFVPVKL